MRLSDVLATKGSAVFSIKPTDSVRDAVALMADKGIGALVVLGDDGVAGIVSERDVARKLAVTTSDVRQTAAAGIMSSPVTCATPDLTIQEAMQIMTEQRIRHLPVVRERQVVGVVSIGDLVKAIIDDQRFTIEQLHSYIAS